MPRFTILDSDLSKTSTNKSVQVKRTKQTIKPIFVGSPVRFLEEGGLLQPSQWTQKKTTSNDPDEVEVIRPIASNISSDSHNIKGSIDFYALLNDLAIQRFHD